MTIVSSLTDLPWTWEHLLKNIIVSFQSFNRKLRESADIPPIIGATGGKGAETIWAEAGMGGATTTGLGTGAGGSGWDSDPINP